MGTAKNFVNQTSEEVAFEVQGYLGGKECETRSRGNVADRANL